MKKILKTQMTGKERLLGYKNTNGTINKEEEVRGYKNTPDK